MIRACTIIAGNYLTHARVLADSFFEHHPDGAFAVLIVDDERRELRGLDDRATWWHLDDLDLHTDEIHRLAGIYDVTELSTAVKPLFLQRLLDASADPVIYLDPDIRIYAPLTCLPGLAARHGVVLTPHITEPLPDDGRSVDALFILAAGIYNLGFIGVGPSSRACLDWWWRQTRRRALSDVSQMMFTDQRWADYMPSLFSCYLLKDAAYNVAYWNLHARPLSERDGQYLVGDVPLRFFHFSGFDAHAPWLLSRHQGEQPRILLSEQPLLARLCDEYAAALHQAGLAESRERDYGWDRSADGLEMTMRIRRLYWSAVMAAERGDAAMPPDPFDVERPQAFTAWLNEPDTRAPGAVSRYLYAIYRARPDLQIAFPDLAGVDGERYAEWLRHDGVAQERIAAQLLPSVVPRSPSETTDPVSLPHGVNIVGYFSAELGIGEAARLLATAVDATGGAYATTTRTAECSRQQHRFEERASPGVAFDVNLLCVNADVTAEFARAAGPAFFRNRHTIGYWFWEVDPLAPSMRTAFDHVDEVWTATDYMTQIFRAESDKPVFTVPVPLVPPVVSPSFTRDRLGVPSGRFVFLFVFDFLSVVDRKNPFGLIEAFRAAFTPDEGPVLLLKSINGHRRIAELERLRRAAIDRPDIIIRDGYISGDEKNALIAVCDCYVSLHRAEGLGLTLAEAMALGTPAIATGYSGNRHFMTDDNSFLVEFAMAPVPANCGPYPPGGRWAEPNLAHASRLMRAVYEHPSEAARRAKRAQDDLLFHHGVLVSASVISQRLASIRDARDTAVTTVSAQVEAAPVDAIDTSLNAVPLITPPISVAQTINAHAAVDALNAALAELRRLDVPHVSVDGRPWRRVRAAAQRAMFRAIRPYWYQQRQFQEELVAAVRTSFNRLIEPAAADERDGRDADEVTSG